MFLKNKKYLFDGGSGQTLMEMGLETTGDLWSAQALLNENNHSLVVDMHKNFINAGSQLIVTSNFSVRRRLLKKYNLLEKFEYGIRSAGALALKAKNESDKEGMWAARVKHISEYLNINPSIISHHDHHKCHAYYGYVGCPIKDEPLLVYTMDGFGDGANGTVSIGNPGEMLSEISRSSNCNIGRMYRYATLLLGMRPAEHEYKLMGLAAYNSSKYGNEAYKIYAETLQVDGLGFSYKNKIKDHFFYFKDKLEGQRFDAIAFGIQKRTEELLTKWISNGIKKTGIKNIVMSGGVAQNIKANNLKKLLILKINLPKRH